MLKLAGPMQMALGFFNGFMNNIRNIAIIAHVDHGKTTLVDALLRQSKTALGKEFTDNSELIMDNNDLEKERGITIFSKNASILWKGTKVSPDGSPLTEAVKINIIDTPGHADFGGEVERVLKMADGCLLLVDAKEGPMPQTRFVLKQALDLGLKIIVVLNKCDKVMSPSEDGTLKIDKEGVSKAINKIFDLFLELGADENAAYFPTIYCSSKLGKAGLEPDFDTMTDITPIFEAILEHVPAPGGDVSKPLQMLVTTISGDNYKGRIATARIYNGTVKMGQEIIHINRAREIKKYRLTSLMSFDGLGRSEIKEAQAGDIVAIAGISDVSIGETITENVPNIDLVESLALPLLSIEEPTVKMTFSVNTSPFAGKEGEFKTSRQIQERLFRELQTDVALKVNEISGGWEVSGRGELHLAILIERMRREGYEFQVSRPSVIEKHINDAIHTPYEKVLIEVPEKYSGTVMQKMGLRHGELTNMSINEEIVTMELIISTKAFFGFRSEFIMDTHGLGVVSSSFLEYRKDCGSTFIRERGSLVAHENGIAKLHGLISAQERGELFIAPAAPVYGGQVVGQNSRADDIRVNVCKEKQQTNHRSSGEGVSEHFNTPRTMVLEEALEYINDTELVEVTPKNIRIRKINLNSY